MKSTGFNRWFGLLLAGVFALPGAMTYWKGRSIYVIWTGLAGLFRADHDRVDHSQQHRVHDTTEHLTDGKPSAARRRADSGKVARSFRDHVARYSDMMSPG